jgi:2-C-methyl-D-erythritol 4-phosphate cytidylyltransferase
MMVSTFDPLWGWSFPASIGTPGFDTNIVASDEVASVDAAGNAIVVWSEYMGDQAQLVAVRHSPDAGWGAPEILDAVVGGSFREESVFAGYDGVAVAAWARQESWVLTARAARFGP